MNWLLFDELISYTKHDEGCTYREALCSQPTCDKIHSQPCSCGLESILNDFDQIRKDDEYGSYAGGWF
jgi:hypothetical protein